MTSQGIPGIVLVRGIRRTRQDKVNADLPTFIQN
jgi:hypothetical protein